MKLSKPTVALLKNFSAINGNLVIKPGNVLSTISAAKSIYAQATVPETFPLQFGIYDLNQFIVVLSLFEDPSIEFGEKFAIISEGNRKVKYFCADTEVLTYPVKEIKSPNADVEFFLSTDDLQMIMKTSSALGAGDVSFVGNNGVVTVVITDRKNSAANSFANQLGQVQGGGLDTFTANLKTENLKFVPGDYTVEISSKRAAIFTSGDVSYMVAMESDSTFG